MKKRLKIFFLGGLDLSWFPEVRRGRPSERALCGSPEFGTSTVDELGLIDGDSGESRLGKETEQCKRCQQPL